MKEYCYEDRMIQLVQGNIALLDVDAVVNAANKSLILGGGVAGAIRKFGGPAIQEECSQIGPIEVGGAVLTSAGNLKARHIIHAVGPVYGEGDEESKLKRAVVNSLKIAARKKLASVAFPAISTGIFRFPLKRCAEIMINTAAEFIHRSEFPKKIIFCLYDPEALSIFESTLKQLVNQRFNSQGKKKKEEG